MARAIWNGNLRLASTTFPVQLYSALQDKSIHFHLLDAKTNTRVKQHMVDPDSGDEVPSDKIRKVLELRPGVAVVIRDEDKQTIQPPASHDIELLHFLPSAAITSQWYVRPYYVGPAADEAMYFGLTEALKKTDREALAKWIMRGKEYFGALRQKDGYLLLIELHYSEEVLSARDLPRPTGRELDEREIKMAEQLVNVMRDDFDPADFVDEYRERVMKLIEQKAKGQRPKLAAMPAKRPTQPLVDVLAASLKAAQKPPKRGRVA